jgi:hypothetical protein
MPKIKLKPNSAEFEDDKPPKKKSLCEMPDCQEEGTHKAPKDRGLDNYYLFCLEHVQLYNKAWNYFEGMAPRDVEEHIIKSFYGDRPTWKFDGFDGFDDNLRHRAWQNYHGYTDEEANSKRQEEKKQSRSGHAIDSQTKEYEALMIMGLAPPVTLPVIKKRYKELAKKYHPDLNNNDKHAEELLKSINMAYTILKLAYEAYDKMTKDE